MDKRKKSALPEEILLFEILPKVPAKSLLRFKCVCKQWRSFLKTPIFIKIHLHHVSGTTHRHEKLMFFNNSLTAPLSIQTIDCEDGLISTSHCHPFTGTVVRPMTSSVNGLACVGIRKNYPELSDMIIWNPLTGEYKTISRLVDRKCFSLKAIATELYYTCSSTDDDYKILRVNNDWSVYIYSLKSDSWRKLESTVTNPKHIPYASDHNFSDEKLHFLVRLEERYIIIRLDLKTEKLTKIVVPYASCPCERLSFMVVRGCIELTIFTGDLSGTWTIEEWHMDGDGNWTKVVKSNYSPCACPFYLMRNGNWIVHTTDGVCKLDPEKNTKDILYPYRNEAIFVLGIYIETFVSPNQYIH